MAMKKLIKKTHDRSLREIIENAKAIGVPIYQRPYVWEKSEVGDFVADILYVAQHPNEEHFYGSIVLAESEEGENVAWWVIDGQQRLTTYMLTCKAIHDCIAGLMQSDVFHADILKLKQQQANIRFPLYSPALDAVRLTHSRADAREFQQIMLGGLVDPSSEQLASYHVEIAAKSGLARDAYLQALGSVAKFIAGNDDPELEPLAAFALLASIDARHQGAATQRLDNLVDAATTNCAAVSIEVTSTAAGFAVFEALNDRGKPLSAADLVKNHLMMKAAANLSGHALEAKINEVDSKWDKILEDVGARRFARFFRFFLLLDTDLPSSIPLNKAFEVLRKHYAEKSTDDILNRMSRLAKRYRLINAPGGMQNLDAKRLLTDLKELDSERSAPLVMAALDRDMHKKHKNELNELLWTLQVLYFRRSLILNKDNKVLEQKFIDWGRRLVDAEDCATEAKLISKELAQSVPADEEVGAGLKVRRNMKVSQARWLLRALEDGHLRRKKGVVKVIETAQLEHIMPQTQGAWPELQNREEWVDRLGNLTLLLGKKNAALGNKLWTDKRERISADGLWINEGLSGVQVWDTKAIEARQNELAKKALEYWRI